jgi:GTP pyrophosphokinase
MHYQAEMGVAAHWLYAQVKSKGMAGEKRDKAVASAPANKLTWVKQLMAWQQEISDNQAFLDALKFDALAKRNFVFSPKGDVYDLPAGATPIDFAYAVHTDMGHQAGSAKVNGKMVPLNHALNNGDVVEIIIDKKRNSPNHDWLDFVVTSTARRQIQKSLKL